ncbi:hypothetical protein Leryth_001570 [Lithospermum erythrorhizon]|nr:hypothetical protein Leryth_001570 [Lithospermum erythrorhizon]
MDSSKTSSGDANNPRKDDHAPSTSELMASAKVVADATRAKMTNQEFDQKKAAGAAADILNAASHYGKLDESTGLGKMVDKAEDYLHNYSSTTTTTAGDGHGNTVTKHETTTQTSGNPKDGDGHGKSGGGGYGDYMKMAGDFLKK